MYAYASVPGTRELTDIINWVLADLCAQSRTRFSFTKIGEGSARFLYFLRQGRDVRVYRLKSRLDFP